MNFAIQTNNLTKTFSFNKKTFTAVNGINLMVKSGEIFGFLGPNSAGKTTLNRLLVGQLQSQTGTVFVNGANIRYWNCRLKKRNS